MPNAFFLEIAHALYSGCTQQQTAQMLGITQSAVAQRMRRIKQIVKGVIDAR